MDPLKDFLDAVAVAVDRAQVLVSTAELAAEARGPVVEQPTRDPRIDPRAGDVVRFRTDRFATFVVHACGEQVWYASRLVHVTDMPLSVWRSMAENARILTPEQGVREGLYDAP